MTRRLLLLLTSCTALFGQARAQEQSGGIERFGLYVVASDLDRATAFYERLFEKPPYVRNAGLVGFDVAGGLYAIVSERAYAAGACRGENVSPYIRVRDIEESFAKVRSFAPESIRSDGVVTEGPFRFFKFADPDGNTIEFFSLGASS